MTHPNKETLEQKVWYRILKVLGYFFIALIGVISILITTLVWPTYKPAYTYRISCNNGKEYTWSDYQQHLRSVERGAIGLFDDLPFGPDFLAKEKVKGNVEEIKSLCDHGSVKGFIPDDSNYKIKINRTFYFLNWCLAIIYGLIVFGAGILLVLGSKKVLLYIIFGNKNKIES